MGLRAGLQRSLGIAERELPAVVSGWLLFFLLFAGYFMLRPVRETMGVAGGVDKLQWLFTGTFVATLLAMPLFGWLASTVPRQRLLGWVYGFFAINLLVFAGLFLWIRDDIWIARAFYIWLSVFNMIAISIAWSVLADLLDLAEAKRTFAIMASGASAGGLVGPLLGAGLVGLLGHAGLLVLSAALLIGALIAARRVQQWRMRNPREAASAGESRQQPLGGSPFAGATAVLRSPFLLAIAAFVVLLASVNTFLYFEQAKFVADLFPDRTRQTQVFGLIDATVQGLAILTQLFFTGRIAQRLGVGVLLVGVPLVVALGFAWLAVAPVFAVFVIVMVVRRAGEYALVRPGREMLFTLVRDEDKYKAKNFIDSVVYRGGDAVSGWAKTLLDLIAQQPALVALAGMLLALAWAVTGYGLGRAARRLQADGEAIRRDVGVKAAA